MQFRHAVCAGVSAALARLATFAAKGINGSNKRTKPRAIRAVLDLGIASSRGNGVEGVFLPRNTQARRFFFSEISASVRIVKRVKRSKFQKPALRGFYGRSTDGVGALANAVEAAYRHGDLFKKALLGAANRDRAVGG